MPRFSIVIPTTRSHLLRGALQSALNQDFDDYEIVVVDNCATGVAEVIDLENAHQKVKYVRTSKRLAMPESWEFGIRHAEGDYVAWICDDDAVVPQLLSTIHRATSLDPSVQVINWTWASYVHPSVIHTAWQNHKQELSLPSFTGRRFVVDNHKVLREFFEPRDARLFVRVKRLLPSVMHACCHHDIITKAIRVAGRFFFPSYPDYASAIVMLALSEKQLWIDEPLTIFGSSPDSNGAASLGNRETLAGFYSEFEYPLFQNVPIKSRWLTRNGVIDTALTVKKAMGTHLATYEYNWEKYFEQCYINISLLRNNGVDVSPEVSEYNSVLNEQSKELRARVHAFIWAYETEQRMWTIIGRLRHMAGPLKRILLKVVSSRNAAIEGPPRFEDIFEASQYLGEIIRQFEVAHRDAVCRSTVLSNIL